MMSLSRSLAWLMAALMTSASGLAKAQDAPLYRDPSPTEGPRIMEPLLPSRPVSPGSMPPPPSTLGPFQSSGPEAGPPANPPQGPLLDVTPMPPPLPALPMPTMFSGEAVEVRRTTKIRGPNGVLGRFHDWFHDTFFGPSRPQAASTAPKHSFFGVFHSTTTSGEGSPRIFNWPSWPTWPLTESGR